MKLEYYKKGNETDGRMKKREESREQEKGCQTWNEIEGEPVNVTRRQMDEGKAALLAGNEQREKNQQLGEEECDDTPSLPLSPSLTK